jgi:anaerobic magnesium-protoporphyrin IX monomethyl ester cyclase
MMFRGAYDSDFYRSFRDLLHEQVVLQQESPARQREHDRARIALGARWDALIATEADHRTETTPAMPLLAPKGKAQASL